MAYINNTIREEKMKTQNYNTPKSYLKYTSDGQPYLMSPPRNARRRNAPLPRPNNGYSPGSPLTPIGVPTGPATPPPSPPSQRDLSCSSPVERWREALPQAPPSPLQTESPVQVFEQSKALYGSSRRKSSVRRASSQSSNWPGA